ncbi:hypothetical protein QEW_2743 [Clostridioides difficile CD160]|nr:hypothetical protein QEW_2743 [Clostridioides difficile CD160]
MYESDFFYKIEKIMHDYGYYNVKLEVSFKDKIKIEFLMNLIIEP